MTGRDDSRSKCDPVTVKSGFDRPGVVLICVLILAGCVASVSPEGDSAGDEFRRSFSSREVSVEVRQEKTDSDKLFSTKFTLGNLTGHPVAILKLSVLDDAEETLFEPEIVRGRFFYRRGRLSLVLDDSPSSGEFIRTSCYLFPGETCEIERALEDFGLRGRRFLVRYLVMGSSGASSRLFAPGAGEDGKIYESISQAEIDRARKAGVRFEDVICPHSGRIGGFRFSVGRR